MSKKGEAEPAEVSRIADVGLAFDPDAFNARGDCRDAILNVLRASMDWGKIPEAQQRDINAAVDQTAEQIIAKLVKAIAAEGREAVRAKVEQLTVKDGIKLSLTALHDHDTLVILGDLVGGHVSLVAADAEAFNHQRGPAALDRDQPELPVGDNSDLVAAADPLDANAKGALVRTGDTIMEGLARVDLKSGMLQAHVGGGADDDPANWADVREATPEELAAERERTQDNFDDTSGGDSADGSKAEEPVAA